MRFIGPRLAGLLALGPGLLPACTSEPSPTMTLRRLSETTGLSSEVGGRLAEHLRVEVLMDGEPAAGITVHWRAIDGSVGSSTSVSDAAGIASMTWVLGNRSGVQRAGASLTTTGDGVEFLVTALPGPPASIEKVAGDRQVLQLWEVPSALQELVVAVRDAHGNPNPGAKVVWGVVAGPPISLTLPHVTSSNDLAVGLAGVVGPGLRQIRAEVEGTQLQAEFSIDIQASDRLVVIQAESGAGYRVVSLQNLTSPPIDTLPAGGTIQWRNTGPFYFGGFLITSEGTPSFLDCFVGHLKGANCRVQFTEPGTYRYRVSLDDPDWLLTGALGTIVVR